MASLLESAKAFGKKLTGKDIESQSLIDVLDETTEKYEKSEEHTYTAGNGITITKDNTINADTKVVAYHNDLTKIPSRILESLNVGDILNFGGNYYYVGFKSDLDIRITGFYSNSFISYFYVKEGKYYKYEHQEWRTIPTYSVPEFLNGDDGEMDWEAYDSIEYLGYCGTDYGMAISIGWDEEKDTIKLSTVVQDNKYYTVSFTFNEPESEGEEPTVSYVITEHTLSNGGGIEFVEIDIEATRINQETLNKLVDFDNQTLKPNFIVLTTENETDTFPILMPSDNLHYVYRSTISDGKCYQLTLHIYEEPTGANIDIEQISVGEEIINLTFDTTEIDLETAKKLTGPNKNNYIIELNNNSETSPGIYLHPNGEYTNTWTSNIIDGSYWEFKITDWQEEGIYVSIEQISVGGMQEPTFNFMVSDLSTSSSGELSADNPIVQWLQALAEEGVETASAKVNVYQAREDERIGTYILLTLAKAYISSRGEVTFSTIIGGDGVYSYTLHINPYLASQWYYHFNVNAIVAPGPK